MDNSTQYNDELLVRYLDNELTEEEKLDMEARLTSEASLRQQLEDLRIAREAVRLYGIRNQVSVIHREMVKKGQAPVRKITSSRRVLKYSMSVAAGIVLLIGAFMAYNFFSLSADKVYSSNYRQYELSTVRGNTEESGAVKAYREKKFREVISINEAGDSSITAGFLAAMSRLELNNPAEAIPGLEKLVELNSQLSQPLFRDEAEYYLALAYIKNRDHDLAIPLLEKIKDDPRHLYHEKVDRKLLRKVKLLKWR